MPTLIYGASDDNIEVEGDFYDEYCGSEADVLMGIAGNQMKSRIEYDGDWTIKVWGDNRGTEFDYTLYPAGHEKAVEISGRDYTDVLVVNDPVDFVVVGMIANRK